MLILFNNKLWGAKSGRVTVRAFILAVFILIGWFYPARAAWPTENVLGVNLDSLLDSVERKTQSIILARMQQEALKQIQQTMNELVMGNQSSNSYLITDYQDFIYGVSYRAGERMMTNVFKTLKQGATEGDKENLREAENYLRKELFGGLGKPNLATFIETETGRKPVDPEGAVFQTKTLNAFYEWRTGRWNSVESIVNNVRPMVINYMNMVQDVQRTKAIANQGFNPQNGVPGSVVAQLVAKSEGAPIEMIANATSAEQVVTSLATSTLTSFLRLGYRTESIPANNQIDKINRKYEGGVETIRQMIYEGRR